MATLAQPDWSQLLPFEQGRQLLLEDGILRERGHYVLTEHPAFPERLIPVDMPPWRYDGLSLKPQRAPRFGEHTEEVMRMVLGHDDDAIANLLAAGAISMAG